jgi:hypothetical protein
VNNEGHGVNLKYYPGICSRFQPGTYRIQSKRVQWLDRDPHSARIKSVNILMYFRHVDPLLGNNREINNYTTAVAK